MRGCKGGRAQGKERQCKGGRASGHKGGRAQGKGQGVQGWESKRAQGWEDTKLVPLKSMFSLTSHISFTARIRSTRVGNNLLRVCLFTGGGGLQRLGPGLSHGGGVPYPGPDRGYPLPSPSGLDGISPTPTPLSGNPFRQCFEFCVSVLCLEFKKFFFSISKDVYLFVLQYHVVSLQNK